MGMSDSELAESFRANLQRIEADRQAKWGPGLTPIRDDIERFRVKYLPPR